MMSCVVNLIALMLNNVLYCKSYNSDIKCYHVL